MPLILNLIYLLLYVFTFSTPTHYDNIIHAYNINDEFLIHNVDGIGKVSITDDFKESMFQKFGPAIHGHVIFDEFTKYIKSVMCLNRHQMLKLDNAMRHYNVKTDKLIPVNKLIFELFEH